MKLKTLLVFLLVSGMALPIRGQGGALRGTAEATVQGKKVTVDYGRPTLKGRAMLSMAQVGTVWRLGMNKATALTSTGDLLVGSTTLKAGKYSLWAKKTGDQSWVLEFHPKWDVWGAPPLKEGFVAELPLQMSTAPSSAEELTITLTGNKDNVTMGIQWGKTVLSGSFRVK